MLNIAIVTDSSSDIPEEISKENEIYVLPMYVGFGGKTYKDGIEASPEDVFKVLHKGDKVTTSGPSIADFINLFDFLLNEKKVEKIYCILLSSTLSGTINTAFIAKKNFEDSKIRIFDSKTSTINLGFIVLETAIALKKTDAEEKVLKLIDFLIKESKFFATLENFKYVLKGGRVQFLSKFLSQALILKPILNINSKGKISLKKFVKNKETAIAELYLQLKRMSEHKSQKKIGIFYGRDIEPALKLKELVEKDQHLDIKELLLVQITTVISAHTGPGVWGIAASPFIDYNNLDQYL